MRAALEYLNEVPLAGLMLTIALGFSLGRLRCRGISLGPAGGTLVVSILLGAYGLSFAELYGTDAPRITVGVLGFALFIYSVGFEAGPRFFSLLRGGSGWRIAFVGALVNVLALAFVVTLGKVLDFGPALTAGVLSGALTSAPTYAAAAEACRDLGPLAVSFALTYPFGLVGVVLLVEFMPRWMRDDLSEGAVSEEERGDGPRSAEMLRAFEVAREEVRGKTLAELDLTNSTGCIVTQLHRGNRVSIADAETRLEPGDHVMARGRLEELQEFERRVGPEVYDEDLRRRLPSPRAVHVAEPEVIGRTLRDLAILRRHHCLVTEVVHGGVSLEPHADLALARDDVVMVVGRRDDVRAVASELGRFERSTQETDIAVYAAGILLGLLLGNLHWQVLGFDFRLGTATGLLMVGVLLGRFRRIGPLSAHVPAPARQLVRDLGILLFISETGVRAGGSSMASLSGLAWVAVAAGTLVTVLPVMLSVLLARYVLRLRAVDAWGSVCGGMTSSAALLAIRNAADSNEPAISYATAYAVGSVLATLAGQIVVLLM